jgi:PAS domain S-box-containing protein
MLPLRFYVFSFCALGFSGFSTKDIRCPMYDEQSLPQLVVVGSSAGGIEALSTLLSTLPTPFPAPIVIAQHLDPSRPSHLGEMLARRSPMPVITVHQHEQLQAGTVYVVPANHHIEVTHHDITPQSDEAGRPKPSIDLLLSSASEVYGERLVAVLLTGTGSDGAMGARAVKQAGGTVVTQDPGTAAFPGMPQVVEPQIVDIVADLPHIGPILLDLLTRVAVPTRPNAGLTAQIEKLQAANASLAAGNKESSQRNATLTEARRKAAQVATRHARQMEVLAEAKRDLLAANQELTRANSELRSTLDDFLSTSDVTQAAVEEVETLNDEMQATNEELEILNKELQAAVEELNTANSDLAVRGDELQSLAVSLEAQQGDAERERARLEAILAGLADAVLVVTAEGKTVLSNEAYRRLFGGGEAGANEELGLINDGDGQTAMMLDEHSRLLLPGETPQARAVRGETFTMAFTLASPSGEERHWLEAIGQPVRGDNDEKWGVVVFRDITERSLRIMQEEFTSLASHELRTPLTVIKGYLHVLANSLKERKDNDRQLKFVEIALGQVDRQMRLIEDLLDVTRLQSGKFSLRREPLRLDTLLERVAETGQIVAKGQKIELTIEGGMAAGEGSGEDARGASRSLLVNGDATRLEQAVLNLVTNAITYAPGSARIDVRLCRVDGLAVDGLATAVAEIEVQDYGKGIAANDLSDLFTRFYQVGQGNPLPAQGLGLGLFIARQIVEAHGGMISVESTEGKGATFIIKLPLLEERA